MRTASSATALALALATALALPAGPLTPPAASAARPPASPPTRLHTPPANPDAYLQAAGLRAQGRHTEAAGIEAMVRTPHAVWFGDQRPAEAERDARGAVLDAAAQRALPVLTLYNVPGRDCASYSAGGASTTAEYRQWIDAVARGIGTWPALVVLEPDSLALLPEDCPGQDDDRGSRTAARYTELNYAVDVLEPLPGTSVYLDAGHPGWHSVASIVPRLIKAGVARATGFHVNASNYQTDEANAWYGRLISSCLAYAGGGGKAADCPGQSAARKDTEAWLAAKATADPAAMKHFVTDTSRNGQGPWKPPAGLYRDPQDWCNPPGRGLGAPPTLATGDPLQDARLWIKTPGESDGPCLRGTAGPQDPVRKAVAPKAGEWFEEQALELVRLARPPLADPA